MGGFKGYSQRSIKRTQGYSIDANLSPNSLGLPHLHIEIYKIRNPEALKIGGSKIFHDSMFINLYFRALPDTVNYYLFIPAFSANKTINAHIASDSDVKTKIDICCKGTPVIGGYKMPDIYGNDITGQVFPAFVKRNN